MPRVDNLLLVHFFMDNFLLCGIINNEKVDEVIPLELVELKEKEYEKFMTENKEKSHFLQSYMWGEFSKKKKKLTPYYLGLRDNNKLVATALLLQKKLPLGYSYFYSPRGFIIDYLDKDLLSEFTSKIKNYIKSKKSIFLKIDPPIIIRRENYLGEEQKLDYEVDTIFDNLTKIGFKHQGFTKNFETMQPRYTFRIDLEKTQEEIDSHFSKTTKQRIQKAIRLGTKVRIGTEKDIDIFYNLMLLTEDRKDFVSYSKDYYEELYSIFNKNDNVKLFIGYLDLDEIISRLKEEKEEMKSKIENIDPNTSSKNGKRKLKEYKTALESLEKEIEKYQEAKKKYGKTIHLNAHMIILYHDKAWVLYAGNHNVLTESYANYHTYYEHIKYCKEKNIKIYDQFGTIGDLNKNNKRLGLHEFKKKFGGDYVEFIGEFDYITNHFMYFVFTKLVPLYRKLIRLKSKKEVNHEVKTNK